MNSLIALKKTDSETFIIAEISANHNQSLDIAKKTIKLIKDSGADAVKIQTYTPDTITIDVRNEYFKLNSGTIWDGKYLYDLYKEAYTPWEWHKELQEFAINIGLEFFSTPFDFTAVDFLESLDVPMYKIASFEILDIPLIEYVAKKGKPIIISTGIASLSDIEEAVNACKRMGNEDITLLQCTSSYPAPIEEANLRNIPHLKETFNVQSGLSDHTLGISVPIAAVALGATVIEKHFILDRSMGGPDSAFSLEPHEFKEMVSAIRDVEKALGSVNYDLNEKKLNNRKLARSLFVVKDINKGEIFTTKNVRSIRPGYGLPPKYYYDVIGKEARNSIKKGTPLKFSDFK